MPEERITEIVQNGRIYRYACTEEITIGSAIWTRDRYENANGRKESFLLVNFVDTGKPKHKTEPAPLRRQNKLDIGKFIQEWKEKGLGK